MLNKLAQTNEIVDNLVNSEAKLQELNKELNEVIIEYNALTQSVESMSFFNMDNVYFWFVICGLLLLVFGFCFLLLELKGGKNKSAKSSEAKKSLAVEPIKTKKIKKNTAKIKEIQKVDSKTVKKTNKVFKVAVRKVK